MASVPFTASIPQYSKWSLLPYNHMEKIVAWRPTYTWPFHWRSSKECGLKYFQVAHGVRTFLEPLAVLNVSVVNRHGSPSPWKPTSDPSHSMTKWLNREGRQWMVKLLPSLKGTEGLCSRLSISWPGIWGLAIHSEKIHQQANKNHNSLKTAQGPGLKWPSWTAAGGTHRRWTDYSREPK